MKFVMTQSICPEGIEKLKADTNGQVEIIAEDNPDPNNYLDDMKDADALCSMGPSLLIKNRAGQKPRPAVCVF